jgi:hypothetical protein
MVRELLRSGVRPASGVHRFLKHAVLRWDKVVQLRCEDGVDANEQVCVCKEDWTMAERALEATGGALVAVLPVVEVPVEHGATVADVGSMLWSDTGRLLPLALRRFGIACGMRRMSGAWCLGAYGGGGGVEWLQQGGCGRGCRTGVGCGADQGGPAAVCCGWGGRGGAGRSGDGSFRKCCGAGLFLFDAFKDGQLYGTLRGSHYR